MPARLDIEVRANAKLTETTRAVERQVAGLNYTRELENFGKETAPETLPLPATTNSELDVGGNATSEADDGVAKSALRVSTPMLRLQLFGVISFSVDTDNSPAGVPTHVRGRPGCLLAYLALARGRYFRRGELVSALWPDQPDSAGTGTFSTVLWRLRKLVERPPLAHGSLITCDRRGALGLHPKAPVELDVELFAQRVLPVLAKPLERMTESDVRALRGGIELYTADILTDLGDEWALREREKHRRHYLSALGRMMQMCAIARDNTSAIRYAQAILDHDALREDVHRELMLLFLGSGQRALALRQFELCRAALKRELAIQPMPETVALYRGIAREAVGTDSGFATAGRLAVPALPAHSDGDLTARELIESARQYLARADAQLQLSLPFF